MSAESLLYVMVRLGAVTLAWVATYLVHSTVLLAGAWAASTRSASAQTRELLWRVALLGGLATATLQTTGAVPAAFQKVSTGNLVEARHWTGQAPSAPVGPVPARTDESASDGRSEPERYASRLPSAGTLLRGVPLALVLAWAVFACAMLARLASATRRARRSLGRRSEVEDAGVLALLNDACARLGFRRPVRLSVSDALGTPVALGRAEICLPRRALEECSEEEMRAVLSHEVAHLVRRDPAWLLVSATVESIFFFQPLNRTARVRLQEQAEYLSDQLAVAHAGNLRLALARALAAVGGWLAAESEPLLAPALGEHRGSIARRVRCLLSDGWPASRLPRVGRWSVGLAAPALVMTGAPGFTAGGPWAWGTPAFQWSGAAAPGSVVEVGGLLGAIRAEPAAGDSVVVRATRHGRASDPDVRFEVVRGADRVTICALYPAPAGSPPNRCTPGRPSAQNNARANDVEIDFVVQVPAGVAFHGYTSTGSIRTGLLRGPVHAESSAGDVDVRTTSHASAATGSGNVRLRMGSTAWADTLLVTTLSGDIRVWLPAEPRAALAARSETGRVSSDFPLQGHRLGRWERMRPRGSLGEHGSGGDAGSGRALVLTSRVGNISIRRTP